MTDSISPLRSQPMDKASSHLRGVDLNLLTVFDAVMQEQNITRAAHNLGMSQPAVSNAVARLKVMFNDELFIRHGRGIQPTQRAKQLFGPIRQALQLVKNELPSSFFSPETSSRQFKLAVCSPSDMRFAAKILNQVSAQAPFIHLHMASESTADLAQKLRYQDIDFVIDYVRFDEAGFCSTQLFEDELVAVAARNHPRISGEMSVDLFSREKHAVINSVVGVTGFADELYRHYPNHDRAYVGSSLSNILYVVAQSELIAVVPRWLAEKVADSLELNVLPLSFYDTPISGYLSWHDSSQKDKGHVWMRDQLLMICGDNA